MKKTSPARTRQIDLFAADVGRLADRQRSGGALSYAITRQVDGWVLEGWPADADQVALFALGGYGRGDMAPYSDIDLLFLLGPRAGERATDSARRQVYRLWDGGFDVGYSIRSLRECIDVALSDTDTRTALLEARRLTGDASVVDAFERDVRPRLLKSRLKKYVQEKLREREHRHQAFGATPYLLEPQIKEGEGGLRDLHAAFWLTRVAFGADGFRGLDRLLTRRDVIKLYAAWDFLQKVRIRLHLASGRRNDILDFQMQDSIAEVLGYRPKYGLEPSERLMRRYYLHARELADRSRDLIEKSVQAVFGRIGGPSRFRRARLDEHFRIERGYLIAQGDDFTGEPGRLLEAFYLHGCHGAPFSAGLRRRITGALRLASGALRGDREAARWFRRILAGPRTYGTLRQMHELGILGRYLPEFGRLRALVVREPYHRYTVDEHSLHAVRALEALAEPTKSVPDWLRDAYRTCPCRDLLNLAVLIHDVGKGEKHGGAHSRVDLRGLLGRLGLEGDDAETVRFLVRDHLLLSEFSQHRDIEDPDVIRTFCRRIASAERLELLLLMTYADISAVRPGFWSPWKAYLIGELYRRARAFLETGRLTREAAGEAAPGVPAALKEHAAAFSGRYARATSPARMERDRRLVSTARHRGFAFELERADAAPLVTLTCTARDTAGLLSTLCRVLAAAGLNIVKADAFSGDDGSVIDRFWISNWDELYWDGLEERLDRDFEACVVHGTPRAPNAPPRRRDVPGVHPEILVDNESFPRQTVFDIVCADRLGLLADILSAIHGAGLDVVWAGIETDGELAFDSIAVRKADLAPLLASLSNLVDVL